MKCIILFILTIASCYAEVEFSGRPRNFSIELLHHTQLETDGHVVISPFGIWTLMTGVALGATGRSRSQLARAFLLPKNQNTILDGYKNLTKIVLEPKTQGVQLTSKNFVFTDKGFAIYPDFKRALTSNFGAMLIELDFTNPKSAARIANTAIESSGATVSNVLRSDDFEKSRMIVTNVISFKGLWSSPFNESDTTVEKFYDENKKEIGQVKMMYQRAMLPYSNLQAISASVVELPYGNDNKYSMLIILPYPKINVAEVYQKLSVVTLKDIFAKLESDVKEFGIEDVDVKLPRFKISTNVVLNKPLNSMGVTDIFNPKLAKFEKVSKNELYISAIVHKADIEVTESGTVASAATSAYFSDRISTPTIEANRPFIYFVIEKSTTTIIFSGIYSKPSIF
ncbi:serine protease inhibitor 2.1-like [Melitaea cinxia]|uniref:serine protease inhibitor 2.1-like n=1 Tax=Melitaea cinxia TaxID=113334 RepID=UPI001E271F9C|nr:serine protease inhibitor 2.1-like [Melitaea cinxia]